MAFIPRLSTSTPTPMQGNHWYYSDNWFSNNGWGPPSLTGNCTWYAYGRYNEIAERVCDLPLGNAGTWWTDPKTSSFQKGSAPALGAICCWSSHTTSAPGHVAIVEEIHSDQSITVSESGYPNIYFRTAHLTRESGYRASWMLDSSRQYVLDGFIYNQLTPAIWHAKDGAGWSKEDAEAYDNAFIIYTYLYSAGWTLNSVCGLLGSIDIESMYNPWLWEGFNTPASTGSFSSLGYGLVQWTPPTKYIGNSFAMQSQYYSPHFSDIPGTPNDGYSQLRFLDNESGQYIDRNYLHPGEYYPPTYAEYKISTETPEYLARAWTWNYEYPNMSYPESDPGFLNRRQIAARYWFDLFQGVTPGPTPTPPPTPSGKHKMPLMFYTRPY